MADKLIQNMQKSHTAIQEAGTSVHRIPFRRLSKTAKESSTAGPRWEGWLLTSEMVTLIKNGVHNIVCCCQPFGCLPNHIVAKGYDQKNQG